MLSNAFLNVLDMSLTASIVIIFVMLARLLLKKAPKAITYALWAVVLLRLLCPLNIESALSIVPQIESAADNYALAQAPAPAVQQGANAYGAPDAGANGGSVQGGAANAYIAQHKSGNTYSAFIFYGSYAWLLGAAAMLLCGAAKYIALRKRLCTAVRSRDNIYLASIPAPFVMGFIRPRIYLPYGLGDKETEYIIAHERHHIKRGDHIFKALGYLALSIYWFDPLVWAAFVLAGRDMEMSCDEAVIAKLGQSIRADYSASLLNFALGRRTAAPIPLAFGEGDAKGRIKNLAGWKKPAVLGVAAAALACAVLAFCLLSDPAQKSYKISITIPAHSNADFVFADAEICPQGSSIAIYEGEHFGDSSVILQSVDADGAILGPAYITPGMATEFNVEKGKWYKVGIDMQNPNDEPERIYVEIKNVEVRIAQTDDNAQIKWFDYFDTPSELYKEEYIQTTRSEFPGVTFRCYADKMEAQNLNGTTLLYTGMPIWSAYFYDLTGDGLPELCSAISYGSGIIDERITVIDYAAGATYELEARGEYDYRLRFDEAQGRLYVDKLEYGSGELAASGALALQNGALGIIADAAAQAASKYYLIIGQSGVAKIAYSAKNSSGVCVRADGAPFEYGEKVWLNEITADGTVPLAGIELSAVDTAGNEVWAGVIPADIAEHASLDLNGWQLIGE